jgi:hypothetical protein
MLPPFQGLKFGIIGIGKTFDFKNEFPIACACSLFNVSYSLFQKNTYVAMNI